LISLGVSVAVGGGLSCKRIYGWVVICTNQWMGIISNLYHGLSIDFFLAVIMVEDISRLCGKTQVEASLDDVFLLIVRLRSPHTL
jgi:hypothetical protein